MRSSTVKLVFAASLVAVPLAACQSPGAATGAAGGAVVGAAVGGPVGAVAGAAIGGATGATLSAEEAGRARTYVVAQRRPSVRLREDVVVGDPLPPRVALYRVPAEVGLRSEYRYTVVNNRPVIVEPSTRRVVYVVD